MKGFFALVFLFVLVSCGSKTTVPEGVLPVSEMTEVMWDVMAADALTSQHYPVDSLKRFDTSAILYPEIAKAHGTTQAQLKKSLQFYEGRPDLLQIIIDSLQKRAVMPLATHKKDTTKKKPPLFQKTTP